MPPKPIKLMHVNARGRLRPWRQQKLKSIGIAKAYESLGNENLSRIGDRVANCANRIDFTVEDGRLNPRKVFACGNRLCAICSAQMARRDFAILAARVAIHARQHQRCLPILLTLTVRNVAGPELKSAVTGLLGAFRKLVRMPVVKRAVIGTHRSLEITFNKEQRTYHPHVHALCFVHDGYFQPNSPIYLTQPAWVALWRKATGCPDEPLVVDVRRMGRDRKGVLDISSDGLFEVTKYATAGLLDETERGWTIDRDVLATIHEAIRGRWLKDVGGSLRKIQKPERPKRPTDKELEDAHIANEAYEFGEFIDAEGEIHGPDYWQRAPPAAFDHWPPLKNPREHTEKDFPTCSSSLA